MIKDLKRYEAIICQQEENLVNVAILMRDKEARQVYVVDAEQKPVGVIGATDIVNKAVAEKKDAEQTKAKDIMTAPIECVDMNKEVEWAMKIMIDKKSYACPVTQDGKLIGVVDYKSVIEKIAEKVKQDES